MKNNFANALTPNQIIEAKGAILHSGHLDEFDMEAMRQASAITRARSMTPRKQGQRQSGFSRTAYHPNRAAYSADPRYVASLDRMVQG